MRRRPMIVLSALVMAGACMAPTPAPPTVAPGGDSPGGTGGQPWPPVATFSILGYDPETGEVGGAVQSRVFSVGNGVLSAEAGVGVVATQAVVDVSYGPHGLRLLSTGLGPQDVVAALLRNDPNPRPEDWPIEGRQFSVM